ncbi:MAG: FG-GAP-like repeat-containing protein [Pirellulales bacterium]
MPAAAARPPAGNHPPAQPTKLPIVERIAVVALSLVIVLGAFVVATPCISPGKKKVLRAAQRAFSEDRHVDAERLAIEYLRDHPDSTEALIIAGESAKKLRDPRRAIDYFARIPEDDSLYGVRALYGRANRLLRVGKLRESEALLRRVLARNPHDLDASADLTYLLQTQARTYESLPTLWTLLRAGEVGGDHLMMIGSTESVALREEQFVAACLQAVPDDPLPLLGKACEAMRTGEHDTARELLDKVLAHDARITEAQARLGRLLLTAGDEAGFQRWHSELPLELPAHPDIWVNRGLWANQHGQRQAAVRCFWEAIKLHPHHTQANHQLAQALAAIGEKQAAREFAERSRLLNRIEYGIREIGEGVEVFEKIAVDLEGLGRHWEAASWYRSLLGFRQPPSWAVTEYERLARQLPSINSMTTSTFDPANRHDFSHLPLPDFGRSPIANGRRTSIAEGAVAGGLHGNGADSDSLGKTGKGSGASRPTMAGTGASGSETAGLGASIRFLNVAAKAGINFRYHNGTDPDAGRAYMFEFNGGGVAVLDYDNDGWPDLYFTQGCRWPVDGSNVSHRDRLYRNIQGERFIEVTESAGLGDTGFSCSATAGDFDNDGWTDLYVGNIGPNRLYRNQGDGTFRDVTIDSGVAGDKWTMGAAFADFNDDGHPDLYVLNYLAGPEVFVHACVSHGRPVQCGPTLFRGEQDRLYLSDGEGRFRDVTEDAGLVAPDGKGLGLLVADFDHTGRLGVFVANDTTANFLFRNSEGPAGRVPRFTEDGLLEGVAFDDQGRAQASMGIAADDADGNGRLDLYVTNFYREPNALYLRDEAGGFVDSIRKAGMYESSFPKMGWGTQFLDADLDGWSDLVLVNGHVNDFSYDRIPFHMPAQCYRNIGSGKFVELPASGLGEYFQEEHLGRGLARLDWNRDGREDFCSTHIDAAPALLENHTSTSGNQVTFKLVGTVGERDATGTRLTLSADGMTWHKQLTGGDGFVSRNQRHLVVGVGSADRVDELTVHWRGGKVETFRDLPVNAEWCLVEGRGTAEPLRVAR